MALRLGRQSHPREERHQMLNLNRRLETYLGRVRMLEEENEVLRMEIQALWHGKQGASSRRNSMEKELHQVRGEVEEAWRERDRAELEVGIVAQELQDLQWQRQRVAEAQAEARTKLENSKKEMEEEQRAQIWLREKAEQLEQEIHLLIQSHHEDMDHLEASLTYSRPIMPPTMPAMSKQTPSLLDLGKEYSQRASVAWKEAAGAYQGQVARLEESLKQAGSQLSQIGQEKSQSQMKLQVLEKELASAWDVRHYLENNTAQQRDTHRLEIQELQEQLQGLEVEKEQLGRQINTLLDDSRDLLQIKMSLGLEVATYRTLLDNESIISSVNQQRNNYITDATSGPKGIKDKYQTLPSMSRASYQLSSFHGLNDTTRPLRMTTTTRWTPKTSTFAKIPQTKTTEGHINAETAENTKCETEATPYPKIQQNGIVEHFRPQEVHEEVSYAEPLSPPNEEAVIECFSLSRQEENIKVEETIQEDWSNVTYGPPIQSTIVESAISYKDESALRSKPTFNDLETYPLQYIEDASGILDEFNKTCMSFELPAEKEEPQVPYSPIDASAEKDFQTSQVEEVPNDTSDSETEAVLEPTMESNTSKPTSEGQPEESVFDQLTDFKQEENISNSNAGTIISKDVSSLEITHAKGVEDKLYPDGEEMDTWDSVIERKVDLNKGDGMKTEESQTQHAEPEEDISVRDLGQDETEMKVALLKQDSDPNGPFLAADTVLDNDRQQEMAHFDQDFLIVNSDVGDNVEEDDSDNLSVSWRTELESDSYAQDNTLADPRPLIRYKSDDTDGNAQASHMDDSESSEGEDDRMIGETGSRTWNESKSKRFGTMEDLCEEAEEEAQNEDYLLGYTYVDDRDVGQVMGSEQQAESGKGDDEKTKKAEKIMEVIGGYSDEETEKLSELAKPKALLDVDYNEGLESVDRLVEQELESLSTATYSAHFAQQHVSKCGPGLDLQATSVQETTEQVFRVTEGEEMFSCAGSDLKVDHELISYNTVIDKPYELTYFNDATIEQPQADVSTQGGVQHEYEEITPETKSEEDDPNVSMLTHAGQLEDHSVSSDFIGRLDAQAYIRDWDNEEPNSSGDESPNASQHSQPISMVKVSAEHQDALLVATIADEPQETVSVEESGASLKDSVKEATDFQVFSEVANLSNSYFSERPSEDSIGQFVDDQKYDNLPQSYFHDDDIAVQDAMMGNGESAEAFSENIPAETDNFLVKCSKESFKTNDNDKSLQGFLSSHVKDDFWGSSVLTGANYQPEGSCNEANVQSNQNLSLDTTLVWGDSEKRHNALGNSKMEEELSTVPVTDEEVKREPSETKQFACRDVVEGKLVHSEDSEEEGHSWSSGEE